MKQLSNLFAAAIWPIAVIMACNFEAMQEKVTDPPKMENQSSGFEIEGSRNIKLRWLIPLVVHDSSVTISGAKSTLSHSAALDFFNQINIRHPRTYDLMVHNGSKRMNGTADEYVVRLLERNEDWQVNLLLAKSMPVSRSEASTPPLVEHFDYFAESGELPPEK